MQCVGAGLCISYWGGKHVALRRAQKPSALGNDVTAAINLLVRVLPLVQMILMRHLYFQVKCCCSCYSSLLMCIAMIPVISLLERSPIPVLKHCLVVRLIHNSEGNAFVI